MLRATGSASLQGIQLGVADLTAAKALFEHVLGLSRSGRDEAGELRFGLGSRWLLLEQGAIDRTDSLHWHCADLSAQRALLAQVGIDLSDHDSMANDDVLLVGGADTGACAASWTTGSSTPPSDASHRLAGILLDVRAPERVAAHWAQMLHAPLGRNAQGLPRIVVDGVALSFAFAEDAVGGVRELLLAIDRPPALQERAGATGVLYSGDRLSVAGLTVRLV